MVFFIFLSRSSSANPLILVSGVLSSCADIDIGFEGKGIDECGYDKSSGKKILSISPDFFRPAEVDLLLGDTTKAKEILNWQPETSEEKLVEMMVNYDLSLMENKS